MGRSPTPVQNIVNKNREADMLTSYELNLEGAIAGMAFEFSEYSYQSATSGQVSNFGGTEGSRANAYMLLPLANNLVDTFSINIGQNEIGGIGALSASGGAGNNIFSEAANATLNAAEQAGTAFGEMMTGEGMSGLIQTATNARAYAGFVGRNLLSAVPGGNSIESGISVGTGMAINPHAALEFKGVGLKTHQFEWKLSPKNAREADTIRKMAKKFRQASLPSYAGASDGAQGTLSKALLKYPDILNIWFVGVNREYFYYFKPCMINSFSVNYAPEGVSLNRGGIPSSVTFSLQVTEASIWTKEDFGDN